MTNAPVTAVASVTVDGIAIPVSTSPTLDGYVFDTYRLLLRGYTYMFTRGYQNVTVQYSAGFSATPMDVQQAVTELAAFKYQRRRQLAVGSKTLAGQTEMFVQKDMPPEAVTIFKNYARVFIG